MRTVMGTMLWMSFRNTQQARMRAEVRVTERAGVRVRGGGRTRASTLVSPWARLQSATPDRQIALSFSRGYGRT